MRYALALSLVLAGLALAACGDDDDADPGAPATSTTEDVGAAAGDELGSSDEARSGDGSAERRPPGTQIVVGDSQYGPMLFDARRQAIYLFDKEESEAAECYGECAAAWPPVLTDGAPQAGAGAEATLLGTIEREDGATQVTYDGHPLYYYAHEGPGQVLCHDIAEFGGLWLVVRPDGDAAPA